MAEAHFIVGKQLEDGRNPVGRQHSEGVHAAPYADLCETLKGKTITLEASGTIDDISSV